ncbi:hypothetical protein LJR231_005931 [Phyllobacterium sp. LjRoot231]
MIHQCGVVGALLIFFALLGTLALFSRDDPLPNQAPPGAVEAAPPALNGN